MKHCPGCDGPIEIGITICPRCGVDTRALWEGGSPDAPQLNAAVQDPRQTRQFISGFLLAVIMSSAVPIFLIGTMISLIIFASTRRNHRTFSRGVMWGMLAGLFGAAFVCSRMVMSYH